MLGGKVLVCFIIIIIIIIPPWFGSIWWFSKALSKSCTLVILSSNDRGAVAVPWVARMAPIWQRSTTSVVGWCLLSLSLWLLWLLLLFQIPDCYSIEKQYIPHTQNVNAESTLIYKYFGWFGVSHHGLMVSQFQKLALCILSIESSKWQWHTTCWCNDISICQTHRDSCLLVWSLIVGLFKGFLVVRLSD